MLQEGLEIRSGRGGRGGVCRILGSCSRSGLVRSCLSSSGPGGLLLLSSLSSSLGGSLGCATSSLGVLSSLSSSSLGCETSSLGVLSSLSSSSLGGGRSNSLGSLGVLSSLSSSSSSLGLLVWNSRHRRGGRRRRSSRSGRRRRSSRGCVEKSQHFFEIVDWLRCSRHSGGTALDNLIR